MHVYKNDELNYILILILLYFENYVRTYDMVQLGIGNRKNIFYTSVCWLMS